MANEKRLIDANAIYDAAERRYQVSSGIEHRCERDLLDLICSADTVDAVEVVHGRWIEGRGSWYVCSVCNTNAGLYSGGIGQNLSNYCPNCGAKMDGERKDNDG